MIELITLCAPDVAPATMLQIIEQESGGNRFAVYVNKLKGKQPSPKSEQEAKAVIQHYLQQGYSVDIGYAQINSNNLHLFGLTDQEAHLLLKPCLNLSASNDILLDNYQRALATTSDPQLALQKALSAYNTGNFTHGFSNGYVAKYYPQSAQQTYSQTPTLVQWHPPKGYYPEEIDMNDEISTIEPDVSMSARDIKLLALSQAQGIEVEFDPDEAASLGAFEEDALSYEDAKASSADPVEVDDD